LESDDDGDGYVECVDTQSNWVTEEPLGYGDCDDNDIALFPIDNDGDGFSICDDDCDDSNAFVYPGAAELESTTECMEDADEDGYGAILSGGCCYTLNMADSYGDGWNGAYLTLSVNGAVTDTFGLASGANGSEEFCVDNGDSIDLEFVGGTFDYEISFELFDPADTSVYTTTNPSAGVVYSDTASCSVTTTVSGSDCDDEDGSAYPGAAEVWYNDIDNACDGGDDFDQDGDGYQSDSHNGSDCDDTDASINIDAIEDITDGLDNNCNGDIDEQFVIETLVTGLSYSYGQPMTIDIDAYDNVHIAYNDSDNIYYLHNTTGIWSTASSAPTTSGATSGEFITGKVDGLDRFQMAFSSYDGTGTDVNLLYVDTITESWSSEWYVDDLSASSTPTADLYLDLDIDSNNLPVIGYYSIDDELPRIADISSSLSSSLSTLGGTWNYIDENCFFSICLGYAGTHLSLAVDSQDTAHAIFFNDVYDAENQYNQIPDDSSSPTCTDWTTGATSSFVEQSGSGIYNSTAIKPQSGDVCVAFQDADNTELMYSCNNTGGCGGWSSTLIESGNTGYYASLEFNSVDTPYIAFYRADTADLEVAYDDGSGWTSLSVDSYGNVGQFIDTAMDSLGNIHIVYYDASNGAIKYAVGQ